MWNNVPRSHAECDADARHDRRAALVLFEYPFHEGIRTMLRLEHLFDRLGTLI